MLNKLHRNHTGAIRMKARAQTIVCSPNIYRDIEWIMKKCLACEKYIREPMVAHEIIPIRFNKNWNGFYGIR